MQKRNVVSIGFLMMISVIFLTCYGWGGRTKENDQDVQTMMSKITPALVKKKVETENMIQPEQGTLIPTQSAKENEQPTQAVKQEEAAPTPTIEELESDQQQGSEMTVIESEKEQMGVVNTKAVNVRVKPLQDALVKHNLEKGDVIQIIDETFDGWYEVKYESGTGYVYSKFITLTDKTE